MSTLDPPLYPILARRYSRSVAKRLLNVGGQTVRLKIENDGWYIGVPEDLFVFFVQRLDVD